MKVLNEIKKDKLIVVGCVLAPILEKLEREFKGIEFAKVNTDENPNLAFKYGIFSIPTVIIFYKGKPAEIERALEQAKA